MYQEFLQALTPSTSSDKLSSSPSSFDYSPILSDESWPHWNSASPSDFSLSPPPNASWSLDKLVEHVFWILIWPRIEKVTFSFRVNHARRIYPYITKENSHFPLFLSYSTNNAYTEEDEASDRANGRAYLFYSNAFTEVVDGRSITCPLTWWSLQYHSNGANILCLAHDHSLPATTLPRYSYFRTTTSSFVNIPGIDVGSRAFWEAQSCVETGENVMARLSANIRPSRVLDHFRNCSHCRRTTKGRFAKVSLLPFKKTQRKKEKDVCVLVDELRVNAERDRDGCVWFSYNFVV